MFTFIGLTFSQVVEDARHGHYERVNEVLKPGGTGMSQTEMQDAVCFAAQNGHVDIVRLMCDNGVDLRADNVLRYCLLYSSINGHLDVLKYFLECVSIHNDDGLFQDAFSKSAGRGHGEIVLFFLENQYGAVRPYLDMALKECIVHGQVRLISSLLSAGADANRVLAQNIISGNVESIRSIINHCTRPAFRSLQHAIYFGHIYCVSIIVSKHLSIYAAHPKYKDIVRLCQVFLDVQDDTYDPLCTIPSLQCLCRGAIAGFSFRQKEYGIGRLSAQWSADVLERFNRRFGAAYDQIAASTSGVHR
jgi:hypothetical protein